MSEGAEISNKGTRSRVTNNRTVSIYLEDWQRTLIKDVMNKDATRWETKIITATHNNYEYGVPDSPMSPKAKRMYFTSWQRAQIRDEIGVECYFIEITPNTSHIFR